MDAKLHIEIAIRAGQVAKSALEFTDSTQSGLLLKLRFKQLVEDMNGLREAVQRAAAQEKE